MSFGFHYNLDHVTISPSTGSTDTIVGQRNYSLNCSVTLFDLRRLPSGAPSPNIQWCFDNCSISPLPSGVTPLPADMSSRNSSSKTYTSTLQFSLLNQSHAGMYTCRFGPGRLMNSVMITVNSKAILKLHASEQDYYYTLNLQLSKVLALS